MRRCGFTASCVPHLGAAQTPGPNAVLPSCPIPPCTVACARATAALAMPCCCCCCCRSFLGSKMASKRRANGEAATGDGEDSGAVVTAEDVKEFTEQMQEAKSRKLS